jgi:hypothetical protein
MKFGGRADEEGNCRSPEMKGECIELFPKAALWHGRFVVHSPPIPLLGIQRSLASPSGEPLRQTGWCEGAIICIWSKK